MFWHFDTEYWEEGEFGVRARIETIVQAPAGSVAEADELN